MRVSVVLPRNAHFGPEQPTAIDLCASDFIRHSQFVSDTTIHCHPVSRPFPDYKVRIVEKHRSARRTSLNFVESVAAAQPDIVVVHQHVPTAAAIAEGVRHVPVVIHRHAHPKQPKNAFQLWREAWRYGKFARSVWPSEAVLAPFASRQPVLGQRAVVIPNGLNLADWTPAAERRQEILFVGRAHPEKGGLPAAKAVRAVLADQPDWRARFVLSRAEDDTSEVEKIRAALAPVQDQVEIAHNLPFAAVKADFERCEIALVPSVYQEPFGRTALEGLAGGAVLVHSGRGGLAGIVGEAGRKVKNVEPDDIAAAIRVLVHDGDLRQNLRAAGFKQAERFDVHKSATRLDELYASVRHEVTNTYRVAG
ncbi:MAG: glycosyltransferase family 4 protein [Pseudomonadota bacterium]